MSRGDPERKLRPGARGAKKQRDLPLPKSDVVEREQGAGYTNGYMFTAAHHHLVLVMAANGMSIGAMANAMQINRDTLKRHFRDELSRGADVIRANMGAVIVNAGLSGNITAARFWLVSHAPEWRAGAAVAEPPPSDQKSQEGAVQFYLPRNGRDQPEVDEPIIIDAVVEKAA